MTEKIPNEIWFVILQNISLEDRLCNVQFVNKHLYFLCNEPSLHGKVDFTSCIFLPERTCLNMLYRLRECVMDLSFYNCHWFTDELFLRVPVLPNLHILNLSGCFLTTKALHALVKKCPKLLDICFPLYFSEQTEISFDQRKADIAKVFKAGTKLKRVHVELYWAGDYAVACEKVWGQIEACVTKYFRQLDSFSFSMDWSDWCPLAEIKFSSISKFTLDLGHAPSNRRFAHPSSVCKMLTSAGLHKRLPHGNVLAGSFKDKFSFAHIKFLSLPFIMSTSNCILFKSQNSLPNLECLIIGNPDLRHIDGAVNCYVAVAQNLLLNCEYPKLKCLSLGQNHFSGSRHVPLEFYTNLSTLRYLEELNVGNLHLDLNMLLEYCSQIKLRAMSFMLNDSVPMFQSASGRVFTKVQKCNFFTHFVTLFPFLKKLQVTLDESADRSVCSVELLEPISVLKHLEELSLNRIPFTNSKTLSNILVKCSNLHSLRLVNVGIGKCQYGDILFHAVRHLSLLRDLRLEHRHLSFTRELADAILQCSSRLEVIVLVNELTAFRTDPDAVKMIRSIFNKLPHLHKFVVIGDGLHNSDLKEEFVTVCGDLLEKGKRVSTYCGPLSGSTRELSYNMPTFLKIADLPNSSIVGAYNAFNFPYN